MLDCRNILLVTALAACNGSGPDDGSPPPPDSAGLPNTTFNWTIVRSGAMSTCAAADADEVRIEATLETGVPINITFQCVLLPGALALAPGRYAVSAQLYDRDRKSTRLNSSHLVISYA